MVEPTSFITSQVAIGEEDLRQTTSCFGSRRLKKNKHLAPAGPGSFGIRFHPAGRAAHLRRSGRTAAPAGLHTQINLKAFFGSLGLVSDQLYQWLPLWLIANGIRLVLVLVEATLRYTLRNCLLVHDQEG